MPERQFAAKERSPGLSPSQPGSVSEPMNDSPDFTVDHAVQFLCKEGFSFFEGHSDECLVSDFDGLRLPTASTEAKQCKEVKKLLDDYVKRENPPRPLSIAVFGPPGSGKSITVKKLRNIVGKDRIESPEEINLSQFSKSEELGRALLSIFSLAKKDVIRMVFFDEFDSSMDGESLGWLRYFLAPMQDGVFYYDGKPISVGKAILVFAGGTSESYDEFVGQNQEESVRKDFVRKKGPDFVSRLRAFIDVRGINGFEKHRVLRRALLLYHLIGRRNGKLVKDDGEGPVNVEEPLIRRMLEGAHYKHESRSLEALLDMCAISDKDKFCEHHLPAPGQMEMHVSRGSLDGMTVGVAAGQDESTAFFPEFSEQLFCRGGNLAHGGDFFRGGPLLRMVEALKNAPDELVKRSPREKRVTNYLAFPSSLNPDFLEQRTREVREIVEFVELPHMPASEVSHWNFEDSVRDEFTKRLDEYFCATKNEETRKPPFDPLRHLAWGIGLFRMRLRLIQDTQALVVIGGKTKDGWGRFPGVAEEVMLAIAHKRPLYILGGAAKKETPDEGKASLAIGRYLGLDQDQQSDPMFGYEDIPPCDYFLQHDWYFRVPFCPNLPGSLKELREYFSVHGLESSKWVDNGLTIEENRKLFQEEDIENCVDLIIRGLTELNSPKRQQ